MKKSLVFIFAVICGFSAIWTGCRLPEIAGNLVAWRISHGSRGKIRMVNPVLVSGPGLHADRIIFEDLKKPPVSLSVSDFTVRNISAGTNFDPKLIALAGRGSLGSGKPRPLRISGRITGDFITGSYQVSNLRVNIDKMGDINVSGRIETKGATSRLSIDLSRFSLTELKDSLGLQALPEAGSLQGRVVLNLRREKDKWNLQRIDYSILFANLHFAEQKIPPLAGRADGYYDPMSGLGHLDKAHITTRTGGEITLSGGITRNGLDLNFDSKGLYLEDLIEALPAAVREKMGLKVENLAGKASYDFEKKAFSSTVTFGLFRASGAGELSGRRNTEEGLSTFGHLRFDGLDLLSLSKLYGEGAVISGNANLDLDFKTQSGKLNFLRAFLETVPKKDVRQHLNFHAVKALLALSTASPVSYLAASDYGYRKLSTAVTYQEGFLTVEGFARKEKGRDYILLGTPFGRTVNIAIDPQGNTIGLGDLKERLGRVLSRPF